MNLAKIVGYKINTNKSMALSHNNNELSEREIKKTISFTIASKRIKYQKINLTKDVKTCISKKENKYFKNLYGTTESPK